MDCKKGAVQWEIIVALVLFTGALLWMNFKKDTESNRFSGQSQQHQLTDRCVGLINIGCGGKEDVAKTPNIYQSGQKVVTEPVVEPVAPTLADSLGVSEKQLASIGHLNFWERIGASLVIMAFVMAMGGLCDAIGGWHILWFRRYLMPVLLGLGISTLTYVFHPVWYSFLVGLAVLPMMGTLCLGYSKDGNFGRGIWMFIQAAVGGLFLVLMSLFFHVHVLVWYLYLIYVIVAGVFGGLYKNWQQFRGDFITGAFALCSLIFWVYLTLQFNL